MTVVGGIFARGGSKAIPGKNLRQVGGESLLSRAIRRGKGVSEIDYLFVSTDSSEIAEHARCSGAEVPFRRPSALSQDDSPEWEAWQHAIRFLDQHLRQTPSVFIAIPTTSPLAQADDVRSCLTFLLESDFDAVVTVTSARRNPDFNMVEFDLSGTVHLLDESASIPARRQDARQIYDLCTVAYAVRAPFLRQGKRLFEGRVGAVQIPPERALDVDTAFDLRVADLLLSSHAYGSANTMRV